MPLPRFASLCALLLLASPLLAQSAGAAAPQPAPSTLPDPVAYVAAQFGSSFKLDAKVPPLFGDLDGDGREDLVLVATSPTPLLSQEKYRYKVADPYDAYFGTGDPKITAQFNLHFDGSGRMLLIVLNWRQPPDPKHITKFVLINTPFERIMLADLRLKKKNLQAIEAVDRSSLHALVFWDGHRWRWSAQGMDVDDDFKMPPLEDNTKMPAPR
jgi:hypothetical protein